MTVEEIKKVLSSIPFKSISFGYNELQISKPDELDKFQIGFRVSPDGKSFTENKHGGWKESWYVIARDSLGDPHFVDLQQENVFTAVHGEGEWFPVSIADDLEHYIAIISTLHNLSKNRQSPIELEKNPLKGEEIDDLLEVIQSEVEEDEEYHYWEYWLDE